MRSPLLTVPEVAELAKVSRTTVRRWIHAGELAATRLPGGRFRVKSSDFVKMIEAS